MLPANREGLRVIILCMDYCEVELSSPLLTLLDAILSWLIIHFAEINRDRSLASWVFVTP